MKELIEKFFVEEIQGNCIDSTFEFGNLHKKTIKCAFEIDGKCHFCGYCSRRDFNLLELD